MVTLKDISDVGLSYIVMNISDMIMRHHNPNWDSKGLRLDKSWITPEGCYWLYKFLSEYGGHVLVNPKVLEWLKQGTNNPDEL